MVNKIQNGALDFVKDFSNYFKDYICEIDMNKYYMSQPLEYYYHYTNMLDRIPTKDLLFENNTNSYIELNDYVFDVYKKYQQEFSKGSKPQKYPLSPDINYLLPKNKIQRIIYYIFK